MKDILSFDGFGLNDCRDPYKPRVATFTRPSYADEFGKLLAAAPELVEALKNALNVLAGLATGDLSSITKDSPAISKARAALAKAGVQS